MTWDYSPTPREINVKKLWENGAHQYLCPGVQGWNQAIHLLDNAYENIKQMTIFAHKYDGEGLLNTDWGDFGHFQHSELSMVGIVYGAAFSWNSDIPEKSAINADISVIEYGDRSASLVEVISHMSNQAVVNWGEFVRILENCRYQVAEREVTAFWEKYDEQTENSQKQIEFCNEAIRNDMAKVSALLVGIEEGKRKYIAPILHMAEGQILINTMFGVIKNVHDGQQNPCTDKRALAEAFEIWYYEYRRQWHKISRESELYRIGELIFWLADYIREL